MRARMLLDAAWLAGFTAYETGPAYGTAEVALGQWLTDRGFREKLLIITHGCQPAADGSPRVSAACLVADIGRSRTALGVDCLDLFLLYRDDPAVPVAVLVDALNEQVHAGRIRAFGASNWRHERIKAANDYAAKKGLIPMAVSSPAFSLAEQVSDPAGRGGVNIGGPHHVIARAWYAKTKLPVFGYSPLAHGLFSGRVTRENCRDAVDAVCLKSYCCPENFDRLDRLNELATRLRRPVSQVALAYTMNVDVNMFAVVGPQTAGDCRDAAAALDLSLSAADVALLDLRSA